MPVKMGNEEIVKYLVKHGADIHKEKRDGETPFIWSLFN